ncbi:MAG: DMT family transporter [Hydrogenophilaceae bacterium]|nr:DMT family transporter [Hydrogenophilaceae bacterium]
MLIASFLFAVMGVLVKLASGHFSSPELVFYRSMFGLLSIYAIIVLARRQWLAPLRSQYLYSHVKRGLSGFLALVMFFYAIAHLPLATAITLNYTAPLFLAAITAWWFREHHGRGLLVAVLIGFAGVAILLQPGWQARDGQAGVIGLISGFFAAVAYLNVRTLGRQGEPEWRVVFYFTLIASLGAAFWMAAAGFAMPRPSDWPLLLAMGITATLAQLAMTRAYRLGNTLTVGTLAYSNVGFSAIYGVILFGDRLPLSAWIGMTLIVLAGIVSVWAGRTVAPSE